MKFRCDRDDLSEALQTVQRGVSSRPGIPALTGVLLEAADDGTLTLTTTDLEVSARLSIGVQVPGGRRDTGACSPAGGHREVALRSPGRLRDGPVPGAHRLRGIRGRSPTAPVDDFPGIEEPSGTAISVEPCRVRRGRRSVA